MSPESAQFLIEKVLPNINIPVTAPDFEEITAKFSLLRRELLEIVQRERGVTGVGIPEATPEEPTPEVEETNPESVEAGA